MNYILTWIYFIFRLSVVHHHIVILQLMKPLYCKKISLEIKIFVPYLQKVPAATRGSEQVPIFDH